MTAAAIAGVTLCEVSQSGEAGLDATNTLAELGDDLGRTRWTFKAAQM